MSLRDVVHGTRDLSCELRGKRDRSDPPFSRRALAFPSRLGPLELLAHDAPKHAGELVVGDRHRMPPYQ